MDIYKKRIISLNDVKEYKEQGYFIIDPHCHSAFSYDVPDVHETSPEYVVSEQARLGIRQVLTDHDTMNGYNYLKKKGKDIISGVEIKILPKKADKLLSCKNMHTLHINVFDLTNEDFKMLEHISDTTADMDEFVAYLRERDLKWVYNHPFWHETREKLNWQAIPALAKHYFDVIELNAGRPKMLNNLALHMAEKFEKGIVASTDTHTGNPGRALVLAEGKNFDEFWTNVKDRKMYIVRQDMSAYGVVGEASTMISNIFRANVNPSKDRRYSPSTGVEFVDNIARTVTSGNLKNRYILKKVIEMMLHTFNYTAGPLIAWKLYVNRENALAESIKPEVMNMIRQLANNKPTPSRVSN